MSALINVFTFLIPFIAIFIAFYAGLRSMNKTKSPRRALKRHVLTTFTVFVLLVTCSFAASAATTDTVYTAAEAASVNASGQIGLALIGAGLSVGLAGIGGGIALAGGAPAAIGATSEDPKAFGKALVFVALGEAIALYGFLIAFLILIKIPTITTLPLTF